MLHMPRLPELLILLVIGLLLFGKRLPEVGRGIGRAIVEFKKGVRGLQDEVDQGVAGSGPAARAEPPKQLDSGEERTVAQQSRQPAAEPATGPRPFPG